MTSLTRYDAPPSSSPRLFAAVVAASFALMAGGLVAVYQVEPREASTTSTAPASPSAGVPGR